MNTFNSIPPRLIKLQVQNRCDDLESLWYMLLYFLRGSLPWQGLEAADAKQKDELVLKKKRKIDAEEVCEGLPREFVAYFDHIRSLAFDQKPKYSYLRKIFRHCFVRQSFKYDNVYDWTILKYMMIMQEREEPESKDASLEGGLTRQKRPAPT